MINYWNKEIIPYSRNPKSTQAKWSGSDTIDKFKQNPESSKWQNIDITYNYSCEGFRTYDFDSLIGKEIDVALGCSHTMGVGNPVECIWPSLLEKSRPYPMLNLGLGAGTTDTVARILTNITGLFQINTVFIFWPEFVRFELYTDERANFIIPQNSQLEQIWNMDQQVSKQRFYKNKLIVDLLGHNTINLTNGLVFKEHRILDWARDGMHFGPETHKLIAKLFSEKLTNIE
jgi:hypothetical protein